MGRTDKLLAKINDPAQAKNITFAEAVTVLIRKGFKLDGGKGSHQV